MTVTDNPAVSADVLSGERLLYSPGRGETFYGIPADHVPAEAVALPLVGEPVALATATHGQVEGVWLTLGAPIKANDALVPVWLYRNGDATRHLCQVDALDIRSSVQGPAPDDPLIGAQYAALARMAAKADAAEQARECRERERVEWLDELVRAAHQYANANNLCEEFDRFMAAHDLPVRQRPYTLTIDAEVTVTLTRDAESEDDAEAQVDVYDVADALGIDRDSLDGWRVRYASPQ